ncbi:MAG: hypothetical protein ACLFSQ_13370 [Candidatus Zixiibacteriota bacterium]
MNRKFIFVVTIALLLFSCAKKKSNDNQNKTDNDSSVKAKSNQMHFNVDTTEIGDCTKDNDLLLEYCPPAEWGKAPDEFKDNMNKQISEGLVDTTIKHNVTELYYTQNGCIFSIAELIFSEGKPQENFERYKQMTIDKFKDQKSRIDTFTKSDIEITQFLVSDKKIVNFKLIFFNPDRRILQLDYIIPLNIYENELQSIESSIGSIEYLENQEAS